MFFGFFNLPDVFYGLLPIVIIATYVGIGVWSGCKYYTEKYTLHFFGGSGDRRFGARFVDSSVLIYGNPCVLVLLFAGLVPVAAVICAVCTDGVQDTQEVDKVIGYVLMDFFILFGGGVAITCPVARLSAHLEWTEAIGHNDADTIAKDITVIEGVEDFSPGAMKLETMRDYMDLLESVRYDRKRTAELIENGSDSVSEADLAKDDELIRRLERRIGYYYRMIDELRPASYWRDGNHERSSGRYDIDLGMDEHIG